MIFGRTVKCKMCKAKEFKQDAYRHWTNVDCFEAFVGFGDRVDIAWLKNWWLCRKCKPTPDPQLRFHDIDGFTYFLSWKFPFIKRG